MPLCLLCFQQYHTLKVFFSFSLLFASLYSKISWIFPSKWATNCEIFVLCKWHVNFLPICCIATTLEAKPIRTIYSLLPPTPAVCAPIVCSLLSSHRDTTFSPSEQTKCSSTWNRNTRACTTFIYTLIGKPWLFLDTLRLGHDMVFVPSWYSSLSHTAPDGKYLITTVHRGDWLHDVCSSIRKWLHTAW